MPKNTGPEELYELMQVLLDDGQSAFWAKKLFPDASPHQICMLDDKEDLSKAMQEIANYTKPMSTFVRLMNSNYWTVMANGKRKVRVGDKLKVFRTWQHAVHTEKTVKILSQGVRAGMPDLIDFLGPNVDFRPYLRRPSGTKQDKRYVGAPAAGSSDDDGDEAVHVPAIQAPALPAVVQVAPTTTEEEEGEVAVEMPRPSRKRARSPPVVEGNDDAEERLAKRVALHLEPFIKSSVESLVKAALPGLLFQLLPTMMHTTPAAAAAAPAALETMACQALTGHAQGLLTAAMPAALSTSTFGLNAPPAMVAPPSALPASASAPAFPSLPLPALPAASSAAPAFLPAPPAASSSAPTFPSTSTSAFAPLPAALTTLEEVDEQFIDSLLSKDALEGDEVLQGKKMLMAPPSPIVNVMSTEMDLSSIYAPNERPLGLGGLGL